MEKENQQFEDTLFNYEYYEPVKQREEQEESMLKSFDGSFSFMQQEESEEVVHEKTPEVTQGEEAVEEVQPEAEQEKETEVVHNAHHVDTEILIRNEVKQLILTRVAEETTLKTLNDINCYFREQIDELKGKEDEILTKNKELYTEVQIDKNRILQCEARLTKIKEMNELLKQNVTNLQSTLNESGIQNLLKKSKDQYIKTQTLKELYKSKIANLNNKIKELTIIGNDRNMILKSKREHLEKILNVLKEKHDEIKIIVASYRQDTEKNLNRKQLLEEKLDGLKSTKGIKYKNMENVIADKEKQCQKHQLKNDNLAERLQKLNKQKLEHEKQLEKIVREIDVLIKKVSGTKEEYQRKEKHLEELKNQLEITNNHSHKNIEELQQNCEKTSLHLEQLRTNISATKDKNNELSKVLNCLKIENTEKSEDNLKWTNKILQQQSEIKNFEVELVQKKLENTTKRTECEELKHECDSLVILLKSSNDEVIHEKERTTQNLENAKIEYETSKTRHEQFLTELKKKQDYSAANSNCLKEKSESLKHEVSEVEELCKKLHQENAFSKIMLEKKKQLLEDIKQKFESLKKDPTQTQIKSIFRSVGNLERKENITKTVKFNEVHSYKSATESSEVSSQPVEQLSQLETSVCEWLQDNPSEAEEEK